MSNGEPFCDSRSDRELMEALGNGDDSALLELMRRYYPAIIAFVVRTFWPDTDEHIAADIVQEVFLRLYKDKLEMKHFQNVRGWLIRVARNRAVDYLRKKRERLAYTIDEGSDEDNRGTRETDIPTLEMGPSECAINAEEAAKVNACLDRLRPREREVLVLRYWLDCSFAEIGEIMGITEAYSRQLHFRGLNRMRDYLQEEGVG